MSAAPTHAPATVTSSPDFTIEELFALAQLTPVAGYALRLRRALEVIAVGGDRLKLQQVARKALAAQEV